MIFDNDYAPPDSPYTDEELQDMADNEAEAKFELRHDELDTDCFGRCFSDADPGL